MPKGVYARPPIEERFWSKVDKTPGLGPNGDCWEWRASTRSNGTGLVYGQLTVDKVHWSAHRFSWKMHFGDPQNMCVCHRCDNTLCVRPDHLFLGTNKDNSFDMLVKGRSMFGEKNKTSVLTEQDVIAIRNSNLTQVKLAEIYGVDQTQISNIITRKQWRHI